MNNFSELCGQDGETFLMRWRGREEGPYAASVIEAKLAANEIGLLHEILHNSQWITIRDYIAEREAVLREQLKAKEEEERRAREELERQEKDREEKRRSELLAEERRKAAQLETIKAQQSFDATVPHRPSGSQAANRSSSGLRLCGILLLIAGLGIAAYFLLVFDSSVESGMGRVNNLGLMADRQNGIIVGVGLAVVGTIMLAIGSRGRN